MSEVKGVYIKSKRAGGHFRGGVKHTDEETYYSIDTFDADKLQRLLSDPALSVRLEDKEGKSVIPAAKAAARSAKISGKTGQGKK